MKFKVKKPAAKPSRPARIQRLFDRCFDPDELELTLSTWGGLSDTLDQIERMEEHYRRSYRRTERRLFQLQKERREREQREPISRPSPATAPPQGDTL